MFSESFRGFDTHTITLKCVALCVVQYVVFISRFLCTHAHLCVCLCVASVSLYSSLRDCQAGSLAGGITAVCIERVHYPSGEKKLNMCLP